MKTIIECNRVEIEDDGSRKDKIIKIIGEQGLIQTIEITSARLPSKWIKNDLTGIIDCERCRLQAPIDITSGEFCKSDYCPWCGAVMKEE